MAKKMTVTDAARILAETSAEKYFYLNGGSTIKSINELYNAMLSMSEEQFTFHRNQKKNDFYNWIMQVIGDQKLANDIALSKTKETTAKKIKARLDYLNSIK